MRTPARSRRPTREEAEAELAAVLRDEPDWLPDLRVVPFELIVSE